MACMRIKRLNELLHETAHENANKISRSSNMSTGGHLFSTWRGFAHWFRHNWKVCV